MQANIGDVDIIGDILAGVGAYGGLGDVEILGDDADAIMEALSGNGDASGGNPKATALARAMHKAREIDPAAVAVRQQAFRRLGYQAVGIAPTVFLAAAGAGGVDIPLAVFRPFKPFELICPGELSPFFQLNSATINGNNQLAGAGPLPLTMFSEVAQRSKFRWETINPSSPMTLNISMFDLAEDRVLRLGFMGAALMK